MVRKHTPNIFAFELREDEQGVNLSCSKHYAINPLIIPSKTICYSMRCNIVVWRGKLLLIIRFFSGQFHNMECSLRNVEVFALELSTSPCGATQIHNFDGDCIFVQKSGCRSFSAGLHTGVVQGDRIYFLGGHTINHVIYIYIYKMVQSGVWLPVYLYPTQGYQRSATSISPFGFFLLNFLLKQM